MNLVDALTTGPAKSGRKIDALLNVCSEEEQEKILEALADVETWSAERLARVLTHKENSSGTFVNVSASSVRRYRWDVLGFAK